MTWQIFGMCGSGMTFSFARAKSRAMQCRPDMEWINKLLRMFAETAYSDGEFNHQSPILSESWVVEWPDSYSACVLSSSIDASISIHLTILCRLHFSANTVCRVDILCHRLRSTQPNQTHCQISKHHCQWVLQRHHLEEIESRKRTQRTGPTKLTRQRRRKIKKKKKRNDGDSPRAYDGRYSAQRLIWITL